MAYRTASVSSSLLTSPSAENSVCMRPDLSPAACRIRGVSTSPIEAITHPVGPTLSSTSIPLRRSANASPHIRRRFAPRTQRGQQLPGDIDRLDAGQRVPQPGRLVERPGKHLSQQEPQPLDHAQSVLLLPHGIGGGRAIIRMPPPPGRALQGGRSPAGTSRPAADRYNGSLWTWGYWP